MKLEPLTDKQRAYLEEFMRTMRAEVVPQIVESDLQLRILAQESRKRLL